MCDYMVIDERGIAVGKCVLDVVRELHLLVAS